MSDEKILKVLVLGLQWTLNVTVDDNDPDVFNRLNYIWQYALYSEKHGLEI